MNEEFEFNTFGLQPFSSETEEERGGKARRPVPGRGLTLANRLKAIKTAKLHKPVKRPWPRPGSKKRPRVPTSSTPAGATPAATEGYRTRDCNEQIRWVQSTLNRILGLNLTVDGMMDVETRSAVRSFQQRQSLPVTGIAGPDTQQALLAATRGPGAVAAGDSAIGDSAAGGNGGGQDQPADEALEFSPAFEFPLGEFSLGSEFENWQGQLNRGISRYAQDEFAGETFSNPFEFEAGSNGTAGDPRIIDLTAQADKSRRILTREPKKVWALVLHQMACCYKVRDPLTRFLKMAPHFAILPDGRILQLHPILSLTGASNGFNAGSVAVEFAGNFPDTRGKWWHGAENGQNQVTPAQIEAGRYLVRYLIRTMGLKVIVAHRQSSGTRDNDPGPDIWYHVGQWAVDTLGLKDGGPGFKIGDGKSIPDLWRKWGQAKTQPELEFSNYKSQGWNAIPALAPAAEVWESEVNRSSSDYVRWVQESLNRILGLQLAVDGDAGVKTRSAIRSFQTQRGLVADGLVGSKTEAALLAAGAGPAPGGSGTPVTQLRPTFRLECPAGCAPFPANQCDTILRGAVLDAIALANNAVNKLTAAQRDSETIRLFRFFFGHDPSRPVPWANNQESGVIVARRFLSCARELGGGRRTLYSCGCADCDPETNAIAVGVSEVCLCQRFWGASPQLGLSARFFRAGVILHEMLHQLFIEFLLHDPNERRRNNAHCYEAFALRLAGHAADQSDVEQCRERPA